jgi:MoaA/NifB/PqqE/SkfB family radical SAM enzyme
MKWMTIVERARSRTSLAARFIAGELARRPRVVNIEVTTRCNAGCDFCSHREAGPGRELEDYRPVVEKLRPVVVNLTGGEPLLRRDLPFLVEGIKRGGPCYVTLLTNGALLSAETARTLRSAGLDGMSISLNHIGREHDDERRIPGLFEHVRAVIPELKGVGLGIDLNTVVLESNVDSLVEMAHLARTWGVGLCLSCYSRGKNGNTSHVVRRLGRLEAAIDELLRLRSSGFPIRSSDWYLRRIPTFFRDGGIPGCQAGRLTVHVTPEGGVKPCPDLPVVDHFSRYDARHALRVACASCWYRCRGEVEAPLTLSRVRDYARHWQ